MRFERLKSRDVFLSVARGSVTVDKTQAAAFDLVELGKETRSRFGPSVMPVSCLATRTP